MSKPFRPVCVPCQVEMKIAENGVNAVLMAFRPPQPYEVWASDLYRCPVCGHEVLTGYAKEASAMHFQEEDMAHELDKPGVFVYERASDSPKYKGD